MTDEVRCPVVCRGGCGCQCVGAEGHEGDCAPEPGPNDYWDRVPA